MATVKGARMGRAVLIACQILWPGAAGAQETLAPELKGEISKQDAIYRATDRESLESYVVNRSLASYAETLPADFARALAALGARDRWLDIGAGEADAILDYYAPEPVAGGAEAPQRYSGEASAVALSIEDRRTARWHKTAAGLAREKLQYFHGRPLRQYSPRELGRFQLITDLLGGFSYTATIDGYMEMALGALVPGGNLYTLLQDVHAEDGRNKPYYPGSPYLTELTGADGSELKVCSWLKAISCVQVSCELREEWKPPIEVYRVHKTCEDVRVPALTPVHFAAGTPPERGFVLKRRAQSEAAR